MFPLCILALLDEDDRAFMEKLYLEYRSLMFQVAYGMLHETNNTKDAINSACASLCKHAPKLKQMACCKQRAYIVTTIENACRDLMRANAKYVLDDKDEVFHEIPDRDVDVEDAVLCIDSVERLKRALTRLPARERMALEMKYFEGQDDETIARAIGIKTGSVRMAIPRAREHVRKILEEGGAI